MSTQTIYPAVSGNPIHNNSGFVKSGGLKTSEVSYVSSVEPTKAYMSGLYDNQYREVRFYTESGAI